MFGNQSSRKNWNCQVFGGKMEDRRGRAPILRCKLNKKHHKLVSQEGRDKNHEGTPSFRGDHYGAHGDGYHAGSIVPSSGMRFEDRRQDFMEKILIRLCIRKIMWRVTMMKCVIDHVIKFNSKTLTRVG
ncbi:hypothetical protein Tco_0493852 [Tanacetum coccineum]